MTDAPSAEYDQLEMTFKKNLPFLCVFLSFLFFSSCAYYNEKNPPDPSTIVASQVSWKQVSSQFFQTRCDTCHGQGGAGITTSDYQSVLQQMNRIKQQISKQKMPPDSALTAYESTLFSDWVQNGMPYQVTGSAE